MMGYHVSKSCNSSNKTAAVFMELWHCVLLQTHCMLQYISPAVAAEHAVPFLSIWGPFCCIPSCMVISCSTPTYCVGRYVLWQLWIARWCVATLLISVYARWHVVNYMAYAIHLEIHVMNYGYSDFLTTLHMMPHPGRLVLMLNVVWTSQLMRSKFPGLPARSSKALAQMFERGNAIAADKANIKSMQSERQKEIEMLLNRWNKNKQCAASVDSASNKTAVLDTHMEQVMYYFCLECGWLRLLLRCK